MRSKNKGKVYKSIEQLKSDIFPRLSKEERALSTKSGSEQLGICMADEAINNLIKERRRADI